MRSMHSSFEGDVIIENFGDALCYAHFRLRYDSDPSGSIATSVDILGKNCLQFFIVDRSHFCE